MSFAEQISPVVGRVLLSSFFLLPAWFKFAAFDATVASYAAQGIRVPELAVAGSGLFEALGGLALALGFRAQFVALLLFAYTAAIAVGVHDFWTVREAAARAVEAELFARYAAVAGGLLLIVGLGSGPASLDHAIK